MADPQLSIFRAELLNRWLNSRFRAFQLRKAVLKFVDEAGKEAPPSPRPFTH